MTDPPHLRVRTKIWVERDDGAVLISDFRARLLEAVAAEGSVAAAARRLGLPYRTAWKKLEEMEVAAGTPLLASASGGVHGGQTSLTEAARAMLNAYRSLRVPAMEAVDDRFAVQREHFPAGPPS